MIMNYEMCKAMWDTRTFVFHKHREEIRDKAETGDERDKAVLESYEKNNWRKASYPISSTGYERVTYNEELKSFDMYYPYHWTSTYKFRTYQDWALAPESELCYRIFPNYCEIYPGIPADETSRGNTEVNKATILYSGYHARAKIYRINKMLHEFGHCWLHTKAGVCYLNDFGEVHNGQRLSTSFVRLSKANSLEDTRNFIRENINLRHRPINNGQSYGYPTHRNHYNIWVRPRKLESNAGYEYRLAGDLDYTREQFKVAANLYKKLYIRNIINVHNMPKKVFANNGDCRDSFLHMYSRMFYAKAHYHESRDYLPNYQYCDLYEIFGLRYGEPLKPDVNVAEYFRYGLPGDYLNSLDLLLANHKDQVEVVKNTPRCEHTEVSIHQGVFSKCCFPYSHFRQRPTYGNGVNPRGDCDLDCGIMRHMLSYLYRNCIKSVSGVSDSPHYEHKNLKPIMTPPDMYVLAAMSYSAHSLTDTEYMLNRLLGFVKSHDDGFDICKMSNAIEYMFTEKESSWCLVDNPENTQRCARPETLAKYLLRLIRHISHIFPQALNEFCMSPDITKEELTHVVSDMNAVMNWFNEEVVNYGFRYEDFKLSNHFLSRGDFTSKLQRVMVDMTVIPELDLDPGSSDPSVQGSIARCMTTERIDLSTILELGYDATPYKSADNLVFTARKQEDGTSEYRTHPATTLGNIVEMCLD